MRMFIGIWPAAPATRTLMAVQERLVGVAPHGALRVTPSDQIHLTLRFLGEVVQDRLEPLAMVLREAMSSFPSFQLQLGGAGAFPNPARARVIWLGVRGDLEVLESVQRAASRAADPFAAQPEDHSYHAHFTLARVRELAKRFNPRRPEWSARPRRDATEPETAPDRVTLGDAILRLEIPDSPPWCVTSIRLVGSQLKPGGPSYTTLAEIPLATTR